MKIERRQALRAAIGLVLGSVLAPNTASAIETGQMLDKGPRWPHKSRTRSQGDQTGRPKPKARTSSRPPAKSR